MPAQSLIDRYRAQFQKLLPPGRALSRTVTSCLADWGEAISVEFARVHDRVLDMYAESFPGTATEMLPDWETVVGLPNDCTYLLTTDADRRAAVLGRLATDYGQSFADFQALAALQSYTLNVSTYETSRAGVMRCGHTPLHNDPWLFASRMSFELKGTDADTVMPCTLNEHAHIYTHINFNPWDTAPVSSLTNLRAHFVAGEFTAHVTSGKNIIETWTNRSTADDFGQGAIPDATTAIEAQVDGWTAANVYDGATLRLLNALNIKNTADTATLLKHGDFQLFVVFHVDSNISGNDTILSSSSEFGLYVSNIAGDTRVSCAYDGANANRIIGIGGTYVVVVGHNGSNLFIQVNGGANNTAAVTGGPWSDEALVLGNGLEGSVLEIIASDFTGVPTVSGTVDAVTDYLMAKYGV